MNPQDVVTVDVVTNPLEAQMVANALRAEGIACTVEGLGQAGVDGNVEVRVLVHAWDADRARKVLKGSNDLAAPAKRSRKRPKKEKSVVQTTRKENGIRRQRVAGKARRGVSPT
jgi:hypothetical protein